MQSAALSQPDVILSDWGSNSRDCFWGAVTHDCACAAAKLSIAVFPSLSFCCRGCRHPPKKVNTLKVNHPVPVFPRYIYHIIQCISKYHHSWSIPGQLTLMLVSELVSKSLQVKRCSVESICILCTYNNWDLPNVHYLTRLARPLGVSPAITCFFHPSHRSLV